MSGLGPSFLKIWTCGSSPRSGSRNAWTRIKNVNRASCLSNFRNFFRRDPNNFLSRFVTMDETWLYHYDPRQSNNQWSGGIAAHPAPKNSECKNPLKKFSPRFFWDQDGILLIDYLPKGQTNNAEYYSSLLVQLKDILKEKRRGKFTKNVLFLHDNAPAHRVLATQKKLAYLGFQYLDHPPYSPDLAPSDYHLFPGLIKQLKGRHFWATQRSLLPRRPVWTEKLLIFLSGL